MLKKEADLLGGGSIFSPVKASSDNEIKCKDEIRIRSVQPSDVQCSLRGREGEEERVGYTQTEQTQTQTQTQTQSLYAYKHTSINLYIYMQVHARLYVPQSHT